jgi:hypothetical protein
MSAGLRREAALLRSAGGPERAERSAVVVGREGCRKARLDSREYQVRLRHR